MLSSKRNRRFKSALTYLVLCLFTVFCVTPFLWMFVTAAKPQVEIRTATPSFFIHNPTFENFSKVLFDTGFIVFIRNSLIVAVSVTLLSLIIAIMSGYAFSRYHKQRLVKGTNLAMMISQMMPGVLLLVPLYIMMQQLKLLDTYFALILAYTTFVIPLCTFMLSSFFDTIPIELEEAAEVDGCSKLRTIVQVIIPVSIPSIVSTGLYAFINAWNEFMFGYVFINSQEFRTVTPAIMLFRGANTTDWGGLMATSVLAILPVTVMFLFLQKLFMAGLMSGSVKG